MNDEIIDQVRQSRSAILESYAWDIEKMMRGLIAKQGSRGHKVVTLDKKQPRQGVAMNAYPPRG